MKSIRGGSLLLIGLIGLAVLVWAAHVKMRSGEARAPFVSPIASASDRLSQTSNNFASLPGGNGSLRAANMTELEKAELAKNFNEKFKPAVEKWCKAYAGHVPFHPEDFTLDRFHSRLGRNLYTFMIGDASLTVGDSNEKAWVFDFMTGNGARALNSVPKAGIVPDLSVPIKAEEVLRMVKADTGDDFKPNQVVIKPTGAACSLSGGAFVDVGRQMMNGMEVMNGKSLALVFGADGKLVNYSGKAF
jgi:hypothetical protein